MMGAMSPPAIGRASTSRPPTSTSSSRLSLNAEGRSARGGVWSTAERRTPTGPASASTPKRRPSSNGPRSARPSGSAVRRTRRRLLRVDRAQGLAPTALDPSAGRRPDALRRLVRNLVSDARAAGGNVHHHNLRANALLGEVHDRMPVILDERAAEDWMNPRENDPKSLKRLLALRSAPDAAGLAAREQCKKRRTSTA